MSETEKSTYDEDIDPAKTYERKVKPNMAFYHRVMATKEDGTRKLAVTGTV